MHKLINKKFIFASLIMTLVLIFIIIASLPLSSQNQEKTNYISQASDSHIRFYKGPETRSIFEPEEYAEKPRQ